MVCVLISYVNGGSYNFCYISAERKSSTKSFFQFSFFSDVRPVTWTVSSRLLSQHLPTRQRWFYHHFLLKWLRKRCLNTVAYWFFDRISINTSVSRQRTNQSILSGKSNLNFYYKWFIWISLKISRQKNCMEYDIVCIP